MNLEEKKNIVADLKERFEKTSNFYLADSSDLTVAQVNSLRRKMHSQGIVYRVAKNTLIKRALEEATGDYSAIYESLKGQSAIFFTDVSNAPAKIIKDFRKKNEKPILKAAYIDSDVYVGDENLDILTNLKSKEELIGDIISMLQSPINNLISALQAPGRNLSGILKTLSEKQD